jgi:proline iminopeptidase
VVNYERYFDNRENPDAWAGGERRIPINTPKGPFSVWVKRTGTNPDCALLFLHGGPGGTHDFFLAADSFLPAAGIQYYYYDQLGAGRSDAPDEPELWTIERFVDEVEQVRKNLGLDASNFFILGQSWGGILAIEYALAYQQHLKGLIISNMMSSIPAYNDYANTVIMPTMDQEVLAEIKAFEASGQTDDPRYEELLLEHHYVLHVLRRPLDQWPEPVLRGFGLINKKIYVPMQGPSELGAAGSLIDWDRTDDLVRITVPTLVMGAEHDTMSPAYLRMMAERLPKGQYHHSPNGSHCAIFDDQENYFAGLISFLNEVA